MFHHHTTYKSRLLLNFSYTILAILMILKRNNSAYISQMKEATRIHHKRLIQFYDCKSDQHLTLP